MIRSPIAIAAALVAALLASSCGRDTAPDPKAGGEQPAAPAGAAREIRVTPELQKKWGLATGPVSRLTASGALTLPGVVALNQGRTGELAAPLEGTVRSIGADLGDQVRAGQVLVVVHSPALAQAETALLQANARRALARRELDRAKALLKDEAIQQREFLRRQSDLEAATTEYGLAESQLHSFGWDHPQIDALLQRAAATTADLSDIVDPTLTLRSPVDGRVITRDVVVGEHVQQGKLLFTVSDLGTLWAILDARERDLPALAAGVRVAIACEVYGDRRFEGRLTRIGDLVDERTRTVKLRVEVPNPGFLLKPNMFVQGTVEATGGRREVLGVPDEAVQTIEGETVVFVVASDRGFIVKPVQLGERVGTSRAVTGGLDGRETIVVAGAFNLKAEFLKSSFAGE